MATTKVDVGALKAALVQAANALFQAGVMQASGHGNLSAKIDDNTMVITAIGSLRGLKTDDLAVVTFDGKVIDGKLDPVAAEIVPMHACVYQTNARAGGVIHTHSPNLTAFALANKPLPAAYEAMVRFGMVDPVPVAAWAPRGSAEAVANIVAAMKVNPTSPAVILGNHGLLAFAVDPLATARIVIIIEEAAGMTLGARCLGGEKPLPDDALARERAHMARFGSVS